MLVAVVEADAIDSMSGASEIDNGSVTNIGVDEEAGLEFTAAEVPEAAFKSDEGVGNGVNVLFVSVLLLLIVLRNALLLEFVLVLLTSVGKKLVVEEPALLAAPIVVFAEALDSVEVAFASSCACALPAMPKSSAATNPKKEAITGRLSLSKR